MVTHKRSIARLAVVMFILTTACFVRAELQLNKGDHITYVGNNLADRMQHDGWLETLIQARFPAHQLSFRNLGFTGDEVDKRPRSSNFGDADQWLTKVNTDVVFAFFGYVESLAGIQNVDSYKDKLTKWATTTKAKSYNDKNKGTRVVLFSPIAHEDLKSPHLPDGSENNERLAAFTQATKEAAEAAGVEFVDLFNSSKALYGKAKQPLTMNGVHLQPNGNQAIAEVAVKALFPNAKTKRNDKQIEDLRQTVINKNFHWFNLYRTVDGYNVYGGRSKLAWHGQSNADVMSREMEIFNVMAQNRDKVAWEAAQGSVTAPKDDNLPENLVVKTNRPGPLEDKTYPFLGGEEAIEKMTVHEGMEVNLFASEEQFPDLINPVQMAVDPDSRLWVATWPTYPHWNPRKPLNDKLVILPDENQDGKADKMIVFADNLNSITGFEFWGGGVLVAAAPELWFLKDTDGDDRADVKIRMLQGVSSADTHHTANALVIGTDGCLYWSRGVFHVTNMETPTTILRSTSSGVYRFDPRTFEVNFNFPIGPNPHGHVVDQWGYQFVNDGTSGTGRYMSIGGGVGSKKTWFQKRVRPVPATGMLSSSHFPPEHEGNFLIANAIGFLGVLQYEVKYNGADITAEEVEPIVFSKDPNFRPSDLEVGGDGALYIADWHNPLIGHMQHNIRDPNRDDQHGRIYRVTAKGRDLIKPAKMMGKPIADVLNSFNAKETGTRYRARLELSGRETADVIKAVDTWTAKLSPSNSSHEQLLLEALWVKEEHRVADLALLKKVFQAKEPRVRAAAIRTLGHWASKLTDQEWGQTLNAAARDESGLVRAEAVKAAVHFDGIAAAEALFEAAVRPTDDELDHVLNYARGKINLDNLVREALANDQKLSPAAEAYAVNAADVRTLTAMDRSHTVFDAFLSRAGVPAAYRNEALTARSKKSGKSITAELLAAIVDADKSNAASLKELTALLNGTPADQLKPESNALKSLASDAAAATTQAAAYAGWITADGNGKAAWEHANKSLDSVRAFLLAASLVKDTKTRESLFPIVAPLMSGLPAHLKSGDTPQAAAASAQMRVEFYTPCRNTADPAAYEKIKPNKTGFAKTISIDEAPITTRDNFTLLFTGAVDIPRSGNYTFYINSDDGSRLYIDGKLLINNDGNHGMREMSGTVALSSGPHALTVCYFDSGGGDGLVASWKGPGINKQPIPASNLSGGGGGTIHDAAIRLVSTIPGHNPEKIAAYAKLITGGKTVATALEALALIHPAEVKKALKPTTIEAIATTLVKHGESLPLALRERASFSTLIALGENLTGSVPINEALAQAVAALRASIPTKIDPKVMAFGREVYFREGHCGTCHQANGLGLAGQYPPIAGTAWVNGSKDRLISMVLHGLWGDLTINGETYKSPPLPPMTPFRDLLKDDEIAAVLTYVRNSWSNRSGEVTAADVKRIRDKTKGRSIFWKPEELLKLYPLEEK